MSIAISPTGTVTFSDGAAMLGTVTLTNGMATLNTSALTAGSHSITVSYSGDDRHNTSNSATLTQTVNKAPLTITAQNATRL
ncbi:Ig-like domain-containing protein, partial [Lacticaseibacillus paracasei]